MNNEEKALEIQHNDPCCIWNNGCPNVRNGAMKMAQWKDEQLGWHDAKKEQPPMDEEVIVLTNILNGKELSTPRVICFGHIVDKNICVDYDGWNIPGVAYWMYYKEPK
jgi:hypothetical protein